MLVVSDEKKRKEGAWSCTGAEQRGYTPCQENVDLGDLSSQLATWRVGSVAVTLAPTSLLHPHTLLPSVGLEFCLQFLQCQREAKKEGIFVGVSVAVGSH